MVTGLARAKGFARMIFALWQSYLSLYWLEDMCSMDGHYVGIR